MLHYCPRALSTYIMWYRPHSQPRCRYSKVTFLLKINCGSCWFAGLTPPITGSSPSFSIKMRSAEVICMVSFGIYVAGFVLFIAGFAAPYWYEIEGVSRTGLWESCTTTGEENCDNIDLDDAPGMIWYDMISSIFRTGKYLQSIRPPIHPKSCLPHPK